MSTSALVPVSGVDYGSSTATSSQTSVFNNLVGQLEQSVGGGDLSTSQTLLNALEGLSPSSATGSGPLSTFLNSVSSALGDGSVSEAQSALTAYQAATAASSSTATPAATGGGTGASSAASIAGGLVLSQLQLSLVSSLLAGGGSPDDSASSSDTLGSLLNILNAAYGSGNGAPTGSSSAASGSSGSTSSSSSPYDALVSAIQTSLSAGTSPAQAALAYLSPTGNYVNTYA